MDRSARLSLPYLQPAQAQKHVTHNEALALLDLAVQLSVEAFEAAEPPATPVPGQAWALAPGATGAWAGQAAGTLAAWSGEAWRFVTPAEGWVATRRGGTEQRVFGPGGWAVAGPEALAGMTGVGIGPGATADALNRLVVRAGATLLDHAGAGHQLKLNKAAETDTASLLFQTGFGGRAEMGTVGSDDFAIKVSADGGTFHAAAVCDGASGGIDFPNGATIAGQAALHRGNLLGPVAQSGGVPTGAVIEQGSTAGGRYVRFADGTQICWMTGVDMGSILASGDGSWDLPYRTDPVMLAWPVPFSAAPAVSCVAAPVTAGPQESRSLVLNAYAPPDPAGWDFVRVARMGGSPHDTDVLLSVMAVGRWA